MSDWCSGYRAALCDFGRLIEDRDLMTEPIAQLLRDLDGDAFVIEHELDNKLARKRLRAQREAIQPALSGLFDATHDPA